MSTQFETPVNDDYTSRTGQSEIPVQSDSKPVEDPIDAETADSDATLGMTPPFSPVFSVGSEGYLQVSQEMGEFGCWWKMVLTRACSQR